jgi:hypothetical protein
MGRAAPYITFWAVLIAHRVTSVALVPLSIPAKKCRDFVKKQVRTNKAAKKY